MRRWHQSLPACRQSPSAPRFLSRAGTLNRDRSRQAIDSLNDPKVRTSTFGKMQAKKCLNRGRRGRSSMHYAHPSVVVCSSFPPSSTETLSSLPRNPWAKLLRVCDWRCSSFFLRQYLHASRSTCYGKKSAARACRDEGNPRTWFLIFFTVGFHFV